MAAILFPWNRASRDTPPEAGKLDASFYDVGVEFDAKKMCAYYVRLFQEPEFLVSRFTKPQLEEGFWAIMGHTIEWSTANIIYDSNLPLSARKDCIESMAVLFERLFAICQRTIGYLGSHVVGFIVLRLALRESKTRAWWRGFGITEYILPDAVQNSCH